MKRNDETNIEYQILSITPLPDCAKEGRKYKYSVTFSVAVINDRAKPISNIGNFNIKLKKKTNKYVDEIVIEKLKEIVQFKAYNQTKINRRFNKIVKKM